VPSLPLFEALVTTADGPHHVRAPGGYETWRFAAHDPATKTWLSVSFFQGYPSRRYLRRYFRFRNRPTRFAPPLPAEYSAVQISVYAGERFVTSTLHLRTADFVAKAGILPGPHQFDRRSDRTIHLIAPGIDLMFHPRYSRDPLEMTLGSGRASHRWRLTDGLCDVSGGIEIGKIKVGFDGRGFHDQLFGSEPILRDLLQGQLFLKDKVLGFYTQGVTHIATFGNESALIETEPAVGASWFPTRWGVFYPRVIRLSNGAVLDRPRLLHSTWCGARVMYLGNCSGEHGLAFCEIIAPRRKAWPLL